MGFGLGTHCTTPGCFLSLLLVYMLSGAGEAQCPADAGYPGGVTHLTNELNVGSIAKFLCPTGEYAWPVSSRTCQANGQWSIMKTLSGRKMTRISCKKMRCPDPSMFENGEYFPRGPYMVGANITFVCNDGYTPRGSMERTCRRNAKWSGEAAVCDDGAGHCADPGVPPGAVKTGFRYDVEESVSYKCATGLELVGSAKRKCQENRRWSGTEVSCQHPYSFDLPEDVGQHFAGSLSGVLSTFEKKGAVGRTVKVEKGGILNVYLLLDASDSVGEDNFQISKECAAELVNGLGAFDMTIQFGILSYATEPVVTIDIFDKDSGDIDYVLELIQDKLVYNKHRGKQGTNIKGALEAVLNMMSLQIHRYKKDVWNSIQHVIILLTDGKPNMGGRPVDMIKRIRETLNITTSREDFLDIYAFGIGDDIDRSELSQIASQKEKEKHIFTLENSEQMKSVFQEITKMRNYGEMCGLNDESEEADEKDRYPWNVLIKSPNKSPCFGSLISSQWVLSAAHCFKELVQQPDKYLFEIGSDTYKGERIEIHKCYNVYRKLDRQIKEDYDYDVALIKLNQKVKFSKSARPICIPCTEPANRAMKKPSTATCNEHRDHLLSSRDIPARFLSKTNDKQKKKDQEEQKKPKELKELEVLIKHNNAREGCISTIRKWDKFKNITNLHDFVSPRHFCVEGEMSCKGESGGSLFVDIRKRKRFFQVGILSFGIYNPCEKRNERKPSANARDFYVNVLEVLPFLRQHLEGELEFLPGIPDAGEVVCPA